MTLPVVGPPQLGNIQPMYLGLPGNFTLQRLMRLPDYGYSISASRAEAVHQLISGGTVVTRVPKTKRIWQLPFSGLTEDSANTLLAFYVGSFGLGPFVLVDPAWRNKFEANTSTFGAVTQTITGWAAQSGAGTLAWDGLDVAAFPQSDIMTWTGAGNGSTIASATWSGSTILPRTADSPVYLIDQSMAGSIYFRTATSTASVTVTLMGQQVNGTSFSGTAVTSTITNSGWTRITAFNNGGGAQIPYLTLKVVCNTTSAPVIWMSCADIQYGPSSANGLIAPWVVGLGSPRVVVAPASGGGFSTGTTLLPYRNQSLTLAEI